jgi:DNA-binding NarL/FixJ family response regulator
MACQLLERRERAIAAVVTQLNGELAAWARECTNLRRAIQIAGRETPMNPPGLTRCQLEVAEQLAGGASNKDIASVLGTSLNTTKSHVRAVLANLGVRSRRDVLRVLASHSTGDNEATPHSRDDAEPVLRR